MVVVGLVGYQALKGTLPIIETNKSIESSLH